MARDARDRLDHQHPLRRNTAPLRDGRAFNPEMVGELPYSASFLDSFGQTGITHGQQNKPCLLPVKGKPMVGTGADGKNSLHTADVATLGSRIGDARRLAGLTQKEVANHFGIQAASVGQWETNVTRPGGGRMLELARLLNTSVEWLENGEGISPFTKAKAMFQRPRIEPTPALEAHPVSFGVRDLPIYGVAQCGPDGVVNFDQDSPIDWFWRPPELAGVQDAFALYAADDSMTDAGIPAGTLVFVHPHRAPQIGRPCLVLKLNQGALIKQFRGNRGGKVVLWQSNPPDELRLGDDEVQAMYRIMGTWL